MDFDVRKIKLLSTPEERARKEAQENHLDAQYGNPVRELQTMYNATRTGKWAFQAITLLSTAAFIFRVTFSHAAEILGIVAATAICGTVAVFASWAVEKMLEGNHVPFWRKLFITKRVDVVLLFLAIFFSAIVVGGAYSGMQVIGEGQGSAPVIESTTTLAEKTQESYDKKDAEIRKIQSCQLKGGYCWKGNLTEKGHARIAALEAEKSALLETMKSTNAITSEKNAIVTGQHLSKIERAQGYLGMLALGSEFIKFIIFIFWGYRSLELARWQRKSNISPTLPEPEEDIEDETYDTHDLGNSYPPSAGGANQTTDPMMGAHAETYRKGIGFRRVLETRFREHYASGRHNLDALRSQWASNERRTQKAAEELGQEHIMLSYPKNTRI